jgi:hypothetical protein
MIYALIFSLLFTLNVHASEIFTICFKGKFYNADKYYKYLIRTGKKQLIATNTYSIYDNNYIPGKDQFVISNNFPGNNTLIKTNRDLRLTIYNHCYYKWSN